jgi:nanoRNase/pAp phosphatase (c-di-AMP/oligoRNAs hydrolase)
MVDTGEWTNQFLERVRASKHPLILTHNNPDPDAMASAWALRWLIEQRLGLTARMAAGGMVRRAENRGMLTELQLPLAALTSVQWGEHDLIILVDTQPDAGNCLLPEGRRPDIVIDHHPERENRGVEMTLVEPGCGATCTIVTEMLDEAGLIPSVPIATALLYGIETDTMRLLRGASERDQGAFLWLLTRADLQLLGRMLSARRPPEYFDLLHRALEAAVIYSGQGIVCDLGETDYLDMIPEVADLLMRRQSITWAVALGRWEGEMYLSLRCSEAHKDAGRILRVAVGTWGVAGGHENMAGGQVDCSKLSDAEVAEMKAAILGEILRAVGVDSQEQRPLIGHRDR